MDCSVSVALSVWLTPNGETQLVGPFKTQLFVISVSEHLVPVGKGQLDHIVDAHRMFTSEFEGGDLFQGAGPKGRSVVSLEIESDQFTIVDDSRNALPVRDPAFITQNRQRTREIRFILGTATENGCQIETFRRFRNVKSDFTQNLVILLRVTQVIRSPGLRETVIRTESHAVHRNSYISGLRAGHFKSTRRLRFAVSSRGKAQNLTNRLVFRFALVEMNKNFDPGIINIDTLTQITKQQIYID